MTKSTGARERRRRREQLFSAELTLRRLLLHLMSSIAWACRRGDQEERAALSDAYDIVGIALGAVRKEWKALDRVQGERW